MVGSNSEGMDIGPKDGRASMIVALRRSAMKLGMMYWELGDFPVIEVICLTIALLLADIVRGLPRARR